MKINGKDYFYDNLNKKEYEIIICDNKSNISKMIQYVNNFIKINEKIFILPIRFRRKRSRYI